MTTATTQRTNHTVFSVELPEDFTPTWNKIDGITVDGNQITIDTARYFFRYENPTWLLVDWELVRSELLGVTETSEQTIEQLASNFIKAHGRSTNDPAKVLKTGYQVAAHIFRDDYVGVGKLDVTEHEVKALREAATIMALNKVELTGRIANVGPCWFFPIATSVVFGFDEDKGKQVDELYHGGWFNEDRRRESVLAHAALGGRLVHGCQASAEMLGGTVLEYGTNLARFTSELGAMGDEWQDRVKAMGRK
ncbi:hypothetical protein [Streptomyces sp. UNOC14_S4]|uniref:hypothetical protein n=1 Tax=Streptomyces sp. UNOC14_S4 TaxID=2872340 RepID=UPI001E4307D1|nr:hypothetical protein [Streptomyces sp. UNOC14_S4]MCC3766001.1 hypothetical protein [Streptomyces sp. UNOC14_S4]